MASRKMTMKDVENLKVGDKVFYVASSRIVSFTLIEKNYSGWYDPTQISRNDMRYYVKDGNSFYLNYWDARKESAKQ